MRVILMHKTNAHWEAGGTPGPKLIQRVGEMVSELSQSGKLAGADGLRATSRGARLRWPAGEPEVTAGPFAGDNELAAGFSVVQAAHLDDAVEWATQQGRILGDAEQGGEMDVRPLTEAWDIGLAPKPERVTALRYMVLRKANAATERGAELSAVQQAALQALRTGKARGVNHLSTVTLKPSSRGRRYKNSSGGISIVDGPFTESKELIAGYLMIDVDSLEEAGRWTERYLDVVTTDEVDLREVESVIG